MYPASVAHASLHGCNLPAVLCCNCCNSVHQLCWALAVRVCVHSPANLIIKSLVRLHTKSGQQLSNIENNHSGHAYVFFPRSLQKLPQQRPQRSLFRADG